jgi:small subunit ribosomal protein S18
MTEQGKILSRRLTGIPAKHQRKIAKAIKHARLLGLLQFVHIK